MTGGSNETEVNEFAVKPMFLLLYEVVITVMPVANCPQMARKSVFSMAQISLKFVTLYQIPTYAYPNFW